jgi:hypothetical protein
MFVVKAMAAVNATCMSQISIAFFLTKNSLYLDAD